ncbi:tyrosine-type recombinase/integrase [Rathayibacter toxicus]|uniref:tyrosine-type recombinase/integrase n=1 Tax=Rathayibacter toxicus TaxID=145458 RepID=UPI0015E46A1F|nr:tyrosine-type recombinase/integrase [Rathayibacter toxicus]QOD10765.1 tyrosine-type recombinase/integrase [Rathayibacter toxicus]
MVVRGVFETGTPKSGERREVPMPVFLVEPLTRICEGKPRDFYLWSDRSVPMSYPNGSDRWFADAVRRAQAIGPTIPTITPHDLRHTASSLAVQADASVKAVQRMLDHASPAMTLDVYADLFGGGLSLRCGVRSA